VRRLLIDALEPDAVPCELAEPHGALYLFVRVRTTLDSMTLTERLIREHRVAVVPGAAFGAVDACYLRVSFGALDEPTAAEGALRLVNGLRLMADS
jgi:aspartate/methionine/tyrosine aminotransferase